MCVNEPYVGISGFTRRDQVEAILDDPTIDLTGAQAPRLMVGVLATGKSLRGGTHRRPARYPPIGDIASIFVAHPRALNLIHYATKDPARLADELMEVAESVDSVAMHGFQLNVPWPEPAQLARFAAYCGRWHLVLQIGPDAIAAMHESPDAIAARAASYGDAIDGVLIDPSGGTGKPFDPSKAKALVQALAAALGPRKTVGVAGGLGPGGTRQVEDLYVAHPDLSVDVETGVRDPVTDAFDHDRAIAYLRDMLRVRSVMRAVALFRP